MTPMNGLMAVCLSGFLLAFAPAAQAWSGQDSETGADVEIERGNLVRPGSTISVYDWNTGSYRDIDVDAVVPNGYGATIEGTDTETGDPVELEME
jgi:hypothetical protein